MSPVAISQGARVLTLLVLIPVLAARAQVRDVRRILSIGTVMIGGWLNWFVVHVNGGMPVKGMRPEWSDGEHIPLTAATKYAALADVHGNVNWAAFSLGDIFCAASILMIGGWWLYERLHSRRSPV